MITEKQNAFTLIELLVVISIIGLLMAIMMPALVSAKAQAYAVVCKSNLCQIAIANINYAMDNDDHYVAAASDMESAFGGMHRWHGIRENKNEPFEPSKGPLAIYLSSGQVKECPSRIKFTKGIEWVNSFEKGCGGYGYNMTYIGSRLWDSQSTDPYAKTTQVDEVKKPAGTLMFADTAFTNRNNQLIEYSFAEPPHSIYYGHISNRYAEPAIHFRHKDKANIVWADGHTDNRILTKFNSKIQNLSSYQMKLTWFDPVDNTLFDLE
jgi:prepilin-type N-terminal cleavage/methylation domain-containing protein/prepilin-type processing-associated H-X9-DG protein